MKKIATNIITGFLGVGKTTAIINLLKTKPDNEVWAILVNEFGEVGVDGALLEGRGAFIKEVPGGCMCCVAGLPMQVGLNLLISEAKPDRILLEPTGLGHPKQIIETLTNEHYGDLLELKSIITLVDPRNLNNSRYFENDNFNDQLTVADVVVANKTDQCNHEDKLRFEAHLSSYCPPKQAVGWVSQGRLDVRWLNYEHTETTLKPSHHHAASELPAAPLVLKEDEQAIRKESKGQGFYSCGWLFNRALVFDYAELYTFLSGLSVDRLKAVVKTGNGVYTFNSVDGVLTSNPLQDSLDSRIEIINETTLPWDKIETALMQAIKY